MRIVVVPDGKSSASLQADDFAEGIELQPSDLPPSLISARQERWRAVKVAREARDVMSRVIERVRQGRAVERTPIMDIASEIVASVTRNPDALRGLCRIREQDRYTFEHSVSVAVIASSFGKALGFTDLQLNHLAQAGLLHDVGKARTPLAILNKPGRLAPDEWEIMRNHVVETREILEQAGFDAPIIDGAAEHHERFDGSGYPRGLSGDAISPFGRMIGISDVYDAFTADRVYRRGEAPTTVLRNLLNTAGKEFDSTFVHQFIQTVGIFPVGTLVRLKSDRLAVVVERDHRELLRPLVRVFYDIASASFISPQDLDLTEQPENDAIASSELPSRWGVKPHLYMD